MTTPGVSIVVVPRERFSQARLSLDSVLAYTAPPFTLIYVDGGSPPDIRRYLEAEARARDFTLLRTSGYVSPNRARNLGFQRVTTPYVVFVDNDVLVTPHWLDRLLTCAEETGASVVGPLYLIGSPESSLVHMAGGSAHVEEREGRRYFIEYHRFANRPLSTVVEHLRREPTETMEFHCLLMRSDALRRLGGFDEALRSAMEHLDLCVAVRAAGGAVWFEPSAVVTYLAPPPFAPGDLRYFLLRWSDGWTRPSLDRFRDKLGLDVADPFLTSQFRYLRAYRHQAWGYLRPAARALDRMGLDALADRLEPLVTSRWINWAVWVRRRPGRARRDRRSQPPASGATRRGGLSPSPGCPKDRGQTHD